MEKISTKVINMFAGPSAGKSTNAAGIFHYMKSKRMNVEYVSEYAKDLVWGKQWEQLDDQISIFGEQHARMYRLLGQVEWIITDSPVLLQLVYMKEGLKKYKPHGDLDQIFENFVVGVFNNFENYNFYIDRGDRKFIQEGRTQDKSRAIEKDMQVKEMLDRLKMPYAIVPNYESIVKELHEHIHSK